jgi:hypothetical protein
MYTTGIIYCRYLSIIIAYVSPNPHWAHVVGYGPFSLCVINREGQCPSSGDINGLMMMTRAKPVRVTSLIISRVYSVIDINHLQPINVLTAGV